MLRIGILGFGRIVRLVHLRVLASIPGVRVVAIADSDPASREHAAREAPEARVLSDNHELLAMPDLDAVLIALGGFDATFGFASEDREWCDRWLQSGKRLAYAPEALVHHAPDPNFSAFVRQHFRYGDGAWRFHRARAQRNGAAMRIEPVDFYAGMVRAPFALRDPEPIRQSLLLIASQAIAPQFLERRRIRGWLLGGDGSRQRRLV